MSESRSVVSHSVAHQASLSMEFSRQEYWSGLPCPSPEDLSDLGIELGSPALQADSLLSEIVSVVQSCLTPCNPMDCSPPSSSVCGISQARILEWVAISSSRGSSRPRDQT